MKWNNKYLYFLNFLMAVKHEDSFVSKDNGQLLDDERQQNVMII